ncbi:MAG: hypothetical protein K0S46_1580 [Moraxellaceae bacterium]|nr:hypothetical protein [Moraxellaceae bacterium]
MAVFRLPAALNRLRPCWRATLLSSLVLGLAACAVAPQAPPNNPVSAPPLPLAASVISLPVSLDLGQMGAGLLKQLPRPLLASSQNRTLPARFSAMQTALSMEPATCSVTALNCGGTRNTVRTVSSDYEAPTEAVVSQEMTVRALDMSMAGSQFALTAEVEFSLDTRFRSAATPLGVASCGKEGARPRFEMMLTGNVGWGSDGEILFSPRPWYVRWLQPCNITAYPATLDSLLDLPGLRDRLQDALEASVFSRLRQASLRAHLERAWIELNTPREIRPGVWLLMRPERVDFAGLEGKGRQVGTAVLVHAWPELVKGVRPDMPVPPMPRPGTGGGDGDGLHIAMRGDLTLREAEASLGRRLAGSVLRVNGEPVQVRSVRLFGHRDKAVIALATSQPMLAEIYLLGRPVYDLERNEVRLRDLAFSEQTQDYLRQSADWLLGGDFLAAVEARAAFPFDATLAAALGELHDLRVAAGDDLTLRGGVLRMQPQALYFTKDSLVAYVLVEGRMALESRQAIVP